MERFENQKKAYQRPIWDCGSSLYDSFELKSFKRQLDSAISARTLSMPHLRGGDYPPPAARNQWAARRCRKISRSLNKLLRSFFRRKSHAAVRDRPREEFYALCDKSGTISGVAAAPKANAGADRGGVPSGFRSLARRTVSDRFTASTKIGVSCD